MQCPVYIRNCYHTHTHTTHTHYTHTHACTQHTPHKGVRHEISIQQNLVKGQIPVDNHITFILAAQVTYQKELWRNSLINQVRVEYLPQHVLAVNMATMRGLLTLNL